MSGVAPTPGLATGRDGTGRHDLPLLDGVRGLAALMVLCTHVAFQTGQVLAGPGGALLARLDFGVALFFVLSGFLLTRPWLRWPPSPRGAAPAAPSRLRRYARLRGARVLPLYWIVLGVVLLTTARGSSGTDIASNALLLQVYDGRLLDGYTQTWSLCTEVAFYLALPWLASWTARRRDQPARLAAAAGAVVLLAWVWTALAAAERLPPWSSTWLPGHLDWFVAGMLLAWVEWRGEALGAYARRCQAAIARQPGTALAVAAAALVVLATPLAGPLTLEPGPPAAAVVKEAGYALVALLVVAVGAFSTPEAGPTAGALASPPSRWLGRVSYGVFLWHLLVLAGVVAALRRPPFSGWFVPVLLLTTAGSLLAAWTTWVLVERPVLRWAHRPAVPR